jgi:hypothetical protein
MVLGDNIERLSSSDGHDIASAAAGEEECHSLLLGIS